MCTHFHWCFVSSSIVLAALFPGARATGDESGAPAPAVRVDMSPELPSLGGIQFWTDEFVYGQWRIQRNGFLKTCRLLNEKDRVVAWGEYEHCHARFLEAKREHVLPAMKPRAVILLHGLMGSRKRMEPIAIYLREREKEAEILNVGYASTQNDIEGHARELAKVVERLEGVKEIDIVAHSMGNLVARRYLSEVEERRGDTSKIAKLRRMVMVAPPNQGARLAVRLYVPSTAFPLNSISRELGPEFAKLRTRLATPACEFGILALRCEKPQGGNPALPGDDDWVVCVDETKLAGAADFCVLKGLHHQGLWQEETMACVHSFLQVGRFHANGPAQPIPREAGAPPVRGDALVPAAFRGGSARPERLQEPAK